MAELPGIQLEKVHVYLKKELQPFTSAEILEATGVDIEASPELLVSLQDKSSKVRREEDGRWRWKSRHYLTGLNGLLQLFAQATEGIIETSLYDSYKGVKDDIAKVKSRGAVYALKAGSKTVLHRREPHLEIRVSEAVKSRYSAIPMLDPIETHRYLIEKGLKESTDVHGTSVSAPVSRKRPKKSDKKRSKRVKLTNVHLRDSGIDLTSDYQHGKKSAFS